jgi:predicted RNA-binding Zn-ribbon protein involved in translation (DUF1610 family)
MRLTIDYQCPQCGAPAELEETDRLFFCEFCRVPSYLTGPGGFRYVLPHNAPEDQEIIYFPYRRLKGMLFSCMGEGGIQTRVIDLSIRAADYDIYPPSLGFRSQALRLRFLTPETLGRFIRPEAREEPFQEVIEQRFTRTLRDRVIHQALIGEAESVIYAPFYETDEGLHDAVLKRPVSSCSTADASATAGETKSPDWRIGFLPTLCPQCGWNLEGERDTLVMLCRNCDTVWRAGKRKFSPIPFARLPEPGDHPFHLPFWRVRAEVSGVILDSHADLVRLANLPKVVQPEWEEQTFCFWIPAFKMTPDAFLRVASGLTLQQPQDPRRTAVPKGTLQPVTLPAQEAIECLKVILAQFIKPPRTVEKRLARMTVRPRKYMLVYVPFEEGHHELIHPRFQLAINKNMLRLTEGI